MPPANDTINATEPTGVLGELASRYFEARDVKDGINQQLKEVNEELNEVTAQIIDAMEDHELEQLRTERGSLTLKVDIHPQVVDLDEFVRWCVDEGRVDYLQKRINAGPYREALLEGFALPAGTDSYKKLNLLMRRRAAGAGE